MDLISKSNFWWNIREASALQIPRFVLADFPAFSASCGECEIPATSSSWTHQLRLVFFLLNTPFVFRIYWNLMIQVFRAGLRSVSLETWDSRQHLRGRNHEVIAAEVSQQRGSNWAEHQTRAPQKLGNHQKDPPIDRICDFSIISKGWWS